MSWFLSPPQVLYRKWALTPLSAPFPLHANPPDADFYQAELPEFITPETQPRDHDFNGKSSLHSPVCSNNIAVISLSASNHTTFFLTPELTRIATVNWYKSTTCTHSTAQEEAIRTWLVLSRNIFEPVHYEDTSTWSSANTHIPMESDQKAIKFLASNDYDIDRAWFNLSCQLGMGKDAVNVKRASELIAKQPIAGIFHDVKEKLFKSGAHKPMLGAYVDDNNDAHTANGETTTSAAAAISKHLKDKRSKQEKEKYRDL